MWSISQVIRGTGILTGLIPKSPGSSQYSWRSRFLMTWMLRETSRYGSWLSKEDDVWYPRCSAMWAGRWQGRGARRLGTSAGLNLKTWNPSGGLIHGFLEYYSIDLFANKQVCERQTARNWGGGPGQWGRCQATHAWMPGRENSGF